MEVSCTKETEDLDLTFSAILIKTGDDSGATWYELTSIHLDELFILGHEISPIPFALAEELISKYGTDPDDYLR